MYDLINPADCALKRCGRDHAPTDKLRNCLTEALYQQSFDFADDTTGSVDWAWHVAKVAIGAMDAVAVLIEDSRYVRIPAGLYLVLENGDGHVRVDHYEDEDEGERDFTEACHQYAAWLDERDDE